MTFSNWLNTLISEKNIDAEQGFQVEGESGTNHMTYGVVVEAIKSAPENEQESIRKTMAMIDFKNGDIRHFLRHLGQAIAV